MHEDTRKPKNFDYIYFFGYSSFWLFKEDKKVVSKEKMVNNRKKGNKLERLAELKLIDGGWLVYRVKGTTKWNLNCDIFSLFDIFCIRRLSEYTECKLIQVKSNKVYGKKLHPFKDFKRLYGDAFDVEIWVKENRKYWDIIRF